MKYVDGFPLNDQGRVTIQDDFPRFYAVGVPITEASQVAGDQGGEAAFYSDKLAFDYQGKVVYQDVATNPYFGVVYRAAGLCKTDTGALLCDSASDVDHTNSFGLPVTKQGYLAIGEGTPPGPKPPAKPVVNTATAKYLNVDYTFSVMEDPSTLTKLEAHYTNAAAKVDNVVDITSAATVSGKTYSVSGVELKPAGTWGIAVRATNAQGTGNYSATKTVTTTNPPGPTPPGKPTIGKPKVTNLSVTAQLTIADDPKTLTKWEMRTVNTAASIDEVVDITSEVGGDLSFTHELKPAGTWSISVRASNAQGAGDYSAAQSVTTVNPPAPQPPVKPTITDATAKDLNVTYTFTTTDDLKTITKWEAHYVNADAREDNVVDITSAVTVSGQSLTVKDVELTPAGTWEISVRATNAVDTGAYSAAKEVKTTKPAGPPVKPVVLNASATGLDVSYEIDTTDDLKTITKWEARYVNTAASVDNTADITKDVYVSGGGLGITTKLEPAGEWQITVRATNAQGAGPFSDVVKVTNKADPNKPMQVSETPKVDFTRVELQPAPNADSSVYYIIDVVDNTYQYKLSSRKVIPDTSVGETEILRVPSKVGVQDNWFTDTKGWDMTYTGVDATGAKGIPSDTSTNDDVIVAATTDAPGKATIAASGDENQYTVLIQAPTTGSNPDGYFVGVGVDTQDDSDFVWTYVDGNVSQYKGVPVGITGKVYTIAVRAYSNTGGMSDEAALYTIND